MHELSFENIHTMKQTTSFLLALALCLLVTKPVDSQTPNCDNDSLGLIPLTDLGSGYYLGYQGGFIPGGSNIELPASQHYKKGRNFAKNLKPLDSLGNISYERGVVLMGGFGPSIPGHILDEFVPIVRDTTDTEFKTNICFDGINMAAGGKGLDYAIGADSVKYWNNMLMKIEEKGYTAEQLQVGWMYFNDKYDTTGTMSFPETPNQIADDLTTYLHMMMTHFPNMKIMFISGRHFGGFADTTLEQYPAISEPSSYWNNFAVKWVIERQIIGTPDLKYFGANIKAPFITWGPYLWTDGSIERSDDHRLYQCSDFSTTDGYHLTDSTNVRDARFLMQHIYNSDFSRFYVRDGDSWSSCVPYLDSIHRTQPDIVDINPIGITLYPNHATENIYVYRHNGSGNLYAVEIYNHLGQLIYQESGDGVTSNNLAIDIADLNSGMYFLRVAMDDSATGTLKWYQQQFIKQ